MTSEFSPLFALLDARPVTPEVLAVGEPTHAEPATLTYRNDLLAALAGRGFRSVALETDRFRARRVDAFVRLHADDDLDAVLAEGFSHGWGAHAGNRELVEWLRARNAAVEPGERIAFHGFDAPLEVASAPSPGPYLLEAFDLVGDRISVSRDQIVEWIGDDARWSGSEAVMDPATSPGAGADAVALRAVADDLLTALRVADLPEQAVHAETALWLLRYHAQAAMPIALGLRVTRLLGIRDAWMAENLIDIRRYERGRGPTLLHAHNGHLQRHTASWNAADWGQGDLDLRWSPAGRLVAPVFGDAYVFVAGSLGASATLGLEAPAEGTFEAGLSAGLSSTPPAGQARTDGQHGYSPLDADLVADADAIWHLAAVGFDGPTEPEVAERIRNIPGVTEFVADEAAGAPPGSHGDRFYFAGVSHRMPFATIVAHDTPEFDEKSRLGRPGVFRLNIALGRAEFTRRFGYPPAEAADHFGTVDFARIGVIMPHPAYAVQGWMSVLNPPVPLLPELDDLLDRARRRASGEAR
ncbi:DUF6194 family protein [Catenuloplanes japonicus]|uniref:DUF6194 family protein n=1 Tax=Catenuloplanes japonicus TaxID=33876 RepID=UPI0005273884|nr:DUF6194 family protein [Catenuloplanes japonicus]